MGRLALLSVVFPHASATGSSCGTDSAGCWPALHHGGLCSLESAIGAESEGDRWGFLQLTSQVRKPFEPVDDLSDASVLLELVGAPPVALPSKTATAQVLNLTPNATSTGSVSEVLLRVLADRNTSHPLVAVAPTGAVIAPLREKTFAGSASWPLLDEAFANVTMTPWLDLGNRSAGHVHSATFSGPDNVSARRQPDVGHADENRSHTQAASQRGPRNDNFLWMLQEAFQAKGGSGNLVEGILLFCLVNIFCCALASGVFFIWNAKSPTDGEDGVAELPEDKPRSSNAKLINAQSNGTVEERAASFSEQRRHMGSEQRTPSVRSVPAAPVHHGPVVPVSPSQGPTRHLCPELVVPRGSECILAVRCLVSARLQQVEFDVRDVNGKAVLRVEVSPHFAGSGSRPWPAQLQRSPVVTLKSLHPRETTGGFILAYCCNVIKEDEGWGAKRNVYIYKEDDELFAHLMKDEIRKRYVLTSGRLGLQLLFEGNFEEHAVDVTNEARELLAATEPSVMDFDPINKHYKLRVAADVDVGLVLCGLLAIDQMEVK